MSFSAPAPHLSQFCAIGDICKMWCSKPILQLQKYCDIIKICTFRPLLFVPPCDPSKKCHDPSCQFDELNLEKLCQIEILEDVTDIVKKFADDQFFIRGILTTETDLEKNSENMKKKGNEAFAKDKLDTAVTLYTKAIELW
ncbi:hypothetical protein Chor_000479 [Crotalus horridus]